MAISRKPQRSPAASADETKIQQLINRGGSPTGEPEGETPTKVSTPILLRIPGEMLAQIEAALNARPVRLPRHTWILEAIYEKLTRELAGKR